MKNYYEILGLKKNANITIIKKAYHKLAMETHPDKGGDPEVFKLVSEAYDILSDNIKRKNYDQEWDVYQDEKEEKTINVSALLETSARPYSEEFKKQHNDLVREYASHPLGLKDKTSYFESFESTLYFISNDNKKTHYPHIYAYLDAMTLLNPQSNIILPNFEDINPNSAVHTLIQFLKGVYYGKALIDIRKDLSIAISKIRLFQTSNKLMDFYEAIETIVEFDLNQETEVLIQALNKITIFAKYDPQTSILFLATLFQNKYYRDFVCFSLHQDWKTKINFLEEKIFQSYDDRKQAEAHVNRLKDLLDQNRSDEQRNGGLIQNLRYFRMILKLEKALHDDESEIKTAHDYRLKAFALLDWIPALLRTSDFAVTANTFLQIGLLFQRASEEETNAMIKMADEKIAVRLYFTALHNLKDKTPHLELYFYCLGMKYVDQLQYLHKDVDLLVQAFQHRSRQIINIFPFIQFEKSNIGILDYEEKDLELTRELLQSLYRMHEFNHQEEIKPEDKIQIDHEYQEVLYQVYEACLKNWYDKRQDHEFEKLIRLKLMKELLSINKWSFFHLEQHLGEPWVMIRRDREGWMLPSRSLPLEKEEEPRTFKSIEGLQIDKEKGEVNFLFKACGKNDPEYSKLLNIADLDELIDEGITNAIFSLDPVDPDMPYHPYNTMRFAPNRLSQTQLFHSMLITDYLLKFFTTGAEVQGKHPYEIRSIQTITEALPAHLKKIIDDFQKATPSEAVHRFWIEAPEIDAEEQKSNDSYRIAFDDMRMLVKKHKMIRDIHGNLQDQKEEANEGREIYVSRKNQPPPQTNNPALVFFEDQAKFYFIDNESISPIFEFKNRDHLLKKLFQLKRNSVGLIEYSSSHIHLIYRLLRDATKQTGFKDYYSPEYIFAEEFTLHYDEFAQYFPEFGRLRELSKALAIIRILESHRENNQSNIKMLNDDLHDQKEWNDFIRPIKIELKENISSNFKDWRTSSSSLAIQTKVRDRLNNLMNDIGSLHFTQYSTEVENVCERMLEDSKSKIISEHGYNAWSHHSSSIKSQINAEKANIAKQMSVAKFNNYFTQLKEVFKEILSETYNSDEILRNFLNGDHSGLEQLMISTHQKNSIKQIQEIYPHQSEYAIKQALNGTDYVIDSIVEKEADKILERNKLALRKKIEAAEKLDLAFKRICPYLNDTETKESNACYWVPASIQHFSYGNHTRMIYGGVSLQTNIRTVQQTNLVSNQATQTSISSTQYSSLVQNNRAQGNAYRDHVGKFFESKGYEVRYEVTHKTPFGNRVIDLEIRKNGEILGGIETKTGNSRYIASQRSKDEWLRMNNYPVNLVRKPPGG